VRYNWLEGGNRQLDLVDAEDSAVIVADPAYHATYVYGNVLVEPDGAGNSQILHYGGDSGTEDDYRKGTLYFYQNTVISTRAGNTTLMRLSTNDEHADCRNNILYVTADGSALSMLDETGVLDLSHNWTKPGWVDCHGTLAGTINDDSTGLTGASPGFVDEAGQDYHLGDGAAPVNAGGDLAAAAPAVSEQYVVHQGHEARPYDPPLDLGAFERCAAGACSAPDAGPTPDAALPADAGVGPDAIVAAPDAAPGGGDSSGCGCRAGGGGPGGLGLLLLAALVLAAARPRRVVR
jgi:MYXO-CTERM domain-containing protein